MAESKGPGCEVTDMEDIPKRLRERYELLVALTDHFCDLHLTEEFKELCRKLVQVVCEEGFAVNRGNPVGWAAGIVHAIGCVNFLDDKTQTPHMTSADMAKAFGISQPTMMAKSVLLRKGLGLGPFDPLWSLRSKLADNPMVWMLKTKEGFIIDIRSAPRELQEEALRLGLIPFIPDPPKGK